MIYAQKKEEKKVFEKTENRIIAERSAKTKLAELDGDNLAMLQGILAGGFFKISEVGGKDFSINNIKTLIEQRDENGVGYTASTYGTSNQWRNQGRKIKKGSKGCYLAIPMFGKDEDKPFNFTFKAFFAQYQTEEMTLLSPNHTI